MIKSKTNTPANKLIGMIEISSSKYYSWRDRFLGEIDLSNQIIIME